MNRNDEVEHQVSCKIWIMVKKDFLYGEFFVSI